MYKNQAGHLLFDIRNRDDYDFMTALRGPDNDDAPPGLKLVTTGVLRYLAGLRESDVLTHMATVASPADAMALMNVWTPTQYERVSSFLHENDHFGAHLKFALGAAEHNGLINTRSERDWLTAVHKLWR